MSSSDPAARAAELRDLLNRASIAYYVGEATIMDDAAYDTLYDELVAIETEHPELVTAGLADAARGRAALRQVPEGAAPVADGIARQGDDRRGDREMGRRRAQAAGYGRARRVRARAEDRRLRDQPRLRERRVRSRRDARRRHPGRGRDAEPPHDQVDPVADERRRAAARRGARRGVHAALRLPRHERTSRRRREGDGSEPAQRIRRLAAAEGLRDHRAAAAVAVGLRHRRPRGARAGDALGDAAVAA